MKKKNIFYSFLLGLTLLSMILWELPLGIFSFRQANNSSTTTITFPSKTMDKKILMVVAFKNFKDEEYFVTKEVLEKAGYLVETTSNQTGKALGVEGNEVIITLSLKDINPLSYEGIVFVGGPGMAQELDNKDFQNLAKAFVENNKLVAAICVAPALLAKANLLKGIKATIWSSNLDKSFVKILENYGALYENKSVVQDGKIITANGPDAALEFGKSIVNLLSL